jgi:hypothetical protein
VGKHCSNRQCFKEKNYKAKFSVSSIVKNKINKDNFEKKTQKKLKKKKKLILGKKQKNQLWGINSQTDSLINCRVGKKQKKQKTKKKTCRE